MAEEELNNDDFISQNQIMKEVELRLKKYQGLNFFESFAMYLGVAQLLEVGLKNLLESDFGYEQKKMEKWTLGRLNLELEKHNFRNDFTEYLKIVIKKRNYIAHELLADKATFDSILNSIDSKSTFTKHERILSKATIELEQICYIFDITMESGEWIMEQR